MKSMLLIFVLLSIAIAVFAVNPYYTASAAATTLQYRVSVNSQNLECILSAPFNGLLGVDFTGGTFGNVIVGYAIGTTASVRDDYGSLSSHFSDTSIGFTNNIITSSGSYTGGTMTINFSIPLNSGDNLYDHTLTIGQTYPIALGYALSTGFNATIVAQGTTSITLHAPVTANDDVTAVPIPGAFNARIYPNPFNSNATLEFNVKSPEPAHVNIYNLKGQLVKSLGTFPLGSHSIQLNYMTGMLESGIYLCRLENNSGHQTIKMVVLK